MAGVDEWMASATEPAGGVRWVLSALQRLPRAAAESPAATVIGAAAATHATGEAPTLPARAALPSDARDNWYPWLLARLPTTSIAVTLVDGGIEFEGSGEKIHPLAVPQTDPVQLELTWHDAGPQRQQVRVTRGERTTVALHADEVDIITLAGQRSTIRRLGRPATSAGLDFAAVRAGHRPAGGLEDIVEQIAKRVREVDGWIAISGDDGTGKTTALCAALDALEAAGYVVLQHFYRRGPSWWDEDETVMRSLVAQLRAAVPELPKLEDVTSPPALRSNVGPKGRELEVLLTMSADRDGPRVVVALDEPPAGGFDEMRAWMSRTALPSLVPPGSSFMLAGRYASGVRDFLEDGDPYWRVDVMATVRDAVCRAYVQSLWDPLIAALGVPATPRVAFSGLATASLTARLQALGFAPLPPETPLQDAVERCDAGVVLLGDKPDREQVAFGRLCRERGRALVVVIVGEEARWDDMQAVAGGDLDVADRIFATDLGRPDAPGADERIAGALGQRLRELVWPFVDELIALGDGRIERVRPIVDWVASQPPGQASLETIPPSLTDRLPWGDLDAYDRHVLAVVAVAHPGFTLADPLWATPRAEWTRLVGTVAKLYELHLLRDPSGVLATLASAEDVLPDALVESFGSALLQSTDPHLADSIRPNIGDEGLADAHRWLAQAQDGRVGAAPDYLARYAMAHAVASGDVEVVRGLCDESALTRQARRFGLQAVAADLPLARTLVGDRVLEAIHDAVVALAGRGGGEADFPRLLYHELAFRLGGDEASDHVHHNEAVQPYLRAWARPFGDPARETGYADIAALVELDGQLTAVSHSGEAFPLGGTEPWRLPSNLGPGAALATLLGSRIAVVAGGTVMIGSRGTGALSPPLPPGNLDLVWAGSAAGGLLAATADGALVHWPQGEVDEPRVLLGHSGALTCVADGPPATWAVIAREALVRIAVDGVIGGYGLFVAEGLVLADGSASAAIASGVELAVQIGDRVHAARIEHREEPGVLTLLRDRGSRTCGPAAGHDGLLDGPARPPRRRWRQRVGRPHRRHRASPTDGRRAGRRERCPGIRAKRPRRVRVRPRLRVRGHHSADGRLVDGGRVDDGGRAVTLLRPRLDRDSAELRRLVGADNWFATGSEDGTVAVWTVDAKAPLAVYRGHNAPVRTVSVVGRYVVSGGDDGTLRVWTLADGREVAVVGAGGAAITASGATEDGCAWGAADGSVGVWRFEAGPVSERLSPHAGSVIGLQVEEDTLLTWAADGSVAVRSLSAEDPESVLHGPAPVGQVARSGPGLIAVLWADDSVTFESVRPQDRAINAECLAVSPNGDAVAIGSGNRYAIAQQNRDWDWHVSDAAPVQCAFARRGRGSRLALLTSADTATGWQGGGRPLSMAAVGDLMAVGRSDGSIALSRPDDFGPRSPLVAALSGPGPVLSLAGADGTTRLLSGHEDGSLLLWDVPSGRLLRKYSQPSAAIHVALAGNYAAAADGATIHLWGAVTGAEVGVLTGGSARVTGLAAIGPVSQSAPRMLVSCDEEGWLRLWDLELRDCLESFRAPRPLVAVAAGAHTVAARDRGGVTYAWTIREPARSAGADVAWTGDQRLEVDQSAQRLEVRGTLAFGADVELRAVRWGGAPGGRATARVAVDQPNGFWDELDEHGAFLAPPLVAAERAIEVQIVGSYEVQMDLDDLHVLIELQAAHLDGPTTLTWRRS